MVAMTREEPVIQRIKVFLIRIRVAKNPMIDPRPKVRKDLLRKLKIHICHPQRQEIITSFALCLMLFHSIH